MTAQENQSELENLYMIALKNNLVNSRVQLAEFCGLSRTTISMGLNGSQRYATDKLVRTVRKAVDEGLQGVRTLESMKKEEQPVKPAPITEEDNEALHYLVEKMIGEMAAQRESYERILLAALQFDKKNA